MPEITFGVLGPLDVRVDGRTVVLRGHKQRLLLALLLLRAGELVSTDRLLTDIWGEQPPKAALSSLQNKVSQLRKALGSDVVRTVATGYSIHAEDESFDLHRFEHLLAGARAADSAERRSAQLQAALDLWRGAPLADLAFEPAVQLDIARLDELRTTAREELVEAGLVLGHHDRLVSELERLVSEHPLRERLRAQFMLALYRSGRQTEALAAYQAARRTLSDELGLVPSEELQRLERAILAHDPSLELPAPIVAIQAPVAGLQPARKTVTILFADVVDSTAMAEQLDPELLRSVIGRYFDVARTALERHGGTVEKFIGDAVMAVFGIPQLHEDDALRAVRAASDLRAATRELANDLVREYRVWFEIRIAVNTGMVLSGDPAGGQPFATGEAVNIASRLEQAAVPGEILLGAETYARVKDAVRAEPHGAISLKGKAAEVHPWRLLALLPGTTGLERSSQTQFLGREDELASLGERLGRAIEERACQLCTIVGPPGIGKSRLANEFAAVQAGGYRLVSGRCLPYGDGITYWPVADIVRGLTGDEGSVEELLAGEEDAPLIAARIGAAIGTSPERAGPAVEIAWAFRKLLEAFARRQPLVTVIDDLQWAEPAFLDLLEYLAAYSSEAPILLVGLTRGDLFESRPAWAGQRPRATLIALDPLSESTAVDLAADLGGRLGVPEKERTRLVALAEGNPLFLEQLILHWAETKSATLPVTIQALLAARVDRLEPAEQTVLLHASVEGRNFHRGALSHVLPADAGITLDARLTALVDKELIDRDRADFQGDEGFRFRHILIRDAAYEAAPKQLRARAHERYADWLQRQAAERATEYEEILGHHLERAYRYRVELGHADEHSRQLARRAAAQLSSAGRRAFDRFDRRTARNLLARASELLPARDSARLDVLPELAAALFNVGEPAQAEALLAEALEAARELGRPALEWRARLKQLHVEGLSSRATWSQIGEQAEEAVSVFRKLGDDAGQAAAWRTRADAYNAQGKLSAALEANTRALARARGRDRQLALARIIRNVPWGPIHVDEAIRRCEQVLAGAEGRLLEATSFASLASLRAMQGRLDEARRLIAGAKAIYHDLGVDPLADLTAFDSAFVEALAGDFVSAERELRFGLEFSQRRNEWNTFSLATALLAHVLCELGRYAEAEELTRKSEHAAATDVWSQIPWRSARAKVLAHGGEIDESEGFAREAVMLAAQTDVLNLHGDALLDLGRVLRVSARTAEAAEVVDSAGRLYHQKGNVVSARNAEAILRELDATTLSR
ncbi:MAG: BTAD domain-containing putative transcriptional regulator [Gaiellaceae bacterium]